MKQFTRENTVKTRNTKRTWALISHVKMQHVRISYVLAITHITSTSKGKMHINKAHFHIWHYIIIYVSLHHQHLLHFLTRPRGGFGVSDKSLEVQYSSHWKSVEI